MRCLIIRVLEGNVDGFLRFFVNARLKAVFIQIRPASALELLYVRSVRDR